MHFFLEGKTTFQVCLKILGLKNLGFINDTHNNIISLHNHIVSLVTNISFQLIIIRQHD